MDEHKKQLIKITNESLEVTDVDLKKTRKDNPFFDAIGYLMDDPVFKKFFTEYLSEWSDTKAVLMIMQTYAFIDDEYYKNMGKRLSSDKIIYLVKKIMMTSDYRRIVVDGMSDYMKNNQAFLAPFRNILFENQAYLENSK